MSKFCLSCGDPMGTRQLIHDASTCEACIERAATSKPKKAKTGLLHFIEEVESHNPMSGTGKLTLPGSGA